MNSSTLKSALAGLVVVVAVGGATWWRLSVSGKAPERIVDQSVTSVRAERARRGTIQSWVFAEGTARSARREYLTFENPGRVAYVLDGPDGEALRDGTPITQGTVLARQDQRSALAEIESSNAGVEEATTQVAVALAEHERAQAEQALSKTTLERFSVLIGQGSASQQEFDEAQTKATVAASTVAQADSRVAAARAKVTSARARLKQAELDLEETELIAPIDGLVAYVNIKEGYYFTPSMIRTDEETAALQSVPFVIIDPTIYEVTVNVPSYSRGRVRAGQPAIVSVNWEASSQLGTNAPPAEGAGFLRGEVFSANPAVTPDGRAVQVKVRVSGDVSRLEDGLFVSVWLAADSHVNVVQVPVDAILHQDNSPYVFVVEGDTVARREVTLGLQEFAMQEVTTGLAEGELVVTDGRFKMSEGVAVRILAARAGKDGAQ